MQPGGTEQQARQRHTSEAQHGGQPGEGERLQQGGAAQPVGVPHNEGEDQLWYSYTVTLAYDGTDYWGWQLQAAPAAQPAGGLPARRQPRPRPTIQLRLEQALTKITGEPRDALRVQAAGRTDAGVHARGQVAQFTARRRPGRAPLAPPALLRALNSLLPADIRAVAAKEVPLDFNVRYALRKTYSYDLDLTPTTADPFLHRFRHRPRRPEALRLDAMADAAQLFVGTHNFSNFANVSADGSHARKSPVKTILRYELLPIDGGARWAPARRQHAQRCHPGPRLGPCQTGLAPNCLEVWTAACAWICVRCCRAPLPCSPLPTYNTFSLQQYAAKSFACVSPGRRLEVEGTGFLYKQVCMLLLVCRGCAALAAAPLHRQGGPETRSARQRCVIAHVHMAACQHHAASPAHTALPTFLLLPRPAGAAHDGCPAGSGRGPAWPRSDCRGLDGGQQGPLWC